MEYQQADYMSTSQQNITSDNKSLNFFLCVWYLHVHVHTHVWKPEVNTIYLSTLISRQSLSLSLIQMAKQWASGISQSALPQHWGRSDVDWESKLRSSCMPNRHCLCLCCVHSPVSFSFLKPSRAAVRLTEVLLYHVQSPAAMHNTAQ